MTQAHPLQWPNGYPRTKCRTDSAFKVTPVQAWDEMMDELRRFNVTSIVVSSNIPLRMDGTPYRDGLREALKDPGVTIFFTRKKRAVSIGCDQYRRPWENIRALGLAVKAFRDMERHGAHQILDQAFEGFTALPSPDMVAEADNKAWWEVLGVSSFATKEQIIAAHRQKVREAGGATTEMNLAKEAGIAAAGGKP